VDNKYVNNKQMKRYKIIIFIQNNNNVIVFWCFWHISKVWNCQKIQFPVMLTRCGH